MVWRSLSIAACSSPKPWLATVHDARTSEWCALGCFAAVRLWMVRRVFLYQPQGYAPRNVAQEPFHLTFTYLIKYICKYTSRDISVRACAHPAPHE